MDELENYECFGVPAHVWLDSNCVPASAASGSTRSNWVHRDAAQLVEAIPSPALDIRAAD